MRRTLIAVGIAAVLASTGLASPAQAAYDDTLTRGDLVTYNRGDYRLSIAPAPGAKKITRFGHRVAATYSVRMLRPGRSSDTVVYSGTLGYYRTAYLRLKTVSIDIRRDYGIRTYLKKVTAFDAAYAKAKVVAHTVHWRHRTLRMDVGISAGNVGSWVKEHGGTTGAQQAGIVIRSDGFFGYEDATVDLLPDAHGTGSTTDYVVYGYDPTDGYSVMFDSATGKTTTTFSTDGRALLQ